METGVDIMPSDDLKNEAVDIPNATDATSSGQNSGNFIISGDLSNVQTVDAGDEADEELFLDFPPAVADNTVYVIDGHSNISAYDAETLKQKWLKKTDAHKYDRKPAGRRCKC